MSVEFSLAMEPEQAIAYFSSKKIVETERWDDLKREAHAKAFTVARSAGYDIVGDIYSSLLEAQKSGEPIEVWKKKLEPLLTKKGWTGVKEDADGNVIELGTPRRLETIYQTNIQSAYMSGQWKGMWENRKNRPYLMYDTKHDGKVRRSHAVLDGRVFSIEDPFWDTHYPPNGYRCRCFAIALNDKDLQRLGKSVETPPPIENIRTVNGKTGEIYETKAYTYIDAKGEPVLAKPDVGFDYNVGKSRFWEAETGVKKAPNPATDWKKSGLFDLRQTPKELILPSPKILTAAGTRDEALVISATAILGLEQIKQIKTPQGEVLIDREVLRHFVEKESDARERYANFILPTLQNPLEVWYRLFTNGDIRPQYIALFDSPQAFLISIQINKDGSLTFWNGFESDFRRMNKNREGEWVWKRY